MTLFKPRFLISARERSRRDVAYGEIIALRQKLPHMSAAQRERELDEACVWAAETARQYFSALTALGGGIGAAALVLAQAFALWNGMLLFAGILIISLLLVHFAGLEQHQSMYYGARRAVQEFSIRPETRFDD